MAYMHHATLNSFESKSLLSKFRLSHFYLLVTSFKYLVAEISSFIHYLKQSVLILFFD